jgi:hypothetical protein
MSLANPTSPDEAKIRAEIAAKQQGCPYPPHGYSTLVVSIESFFSGNTNTSSIAVHVVPYPGLDAICALLNEVRARPDVADVLVEIDDDEPGEDWPFSERVYVLTSASPDAVADWLAPIEPSGAVEHDWTEVECVPGMSQLPEGMRVVSVWWD